MPKEKTKKNLRHNPHIGASLMAQTVKNPPAMLESWVPFLGREDLLEKGMATHPVFLPEEVHVQRTA